MTDFLKIRYCPICGANKLIIPDEEHPYFKCTECNQWMGAMTFEYWEIEYILQKLRMIKRIKLGDLKKEVKE